MASSAASGADCRTSIVIATRDRREELLTTLARLASLPERPATIVIDNGSSDGTPRAVSAAFPEVDVVSLDRNLGAPARNLGAALATTPYVAFADDDSWWAPGALAQAADHLDASPRLAVLQARILVGTDERPDPACQQMARSPLPAGPGLPGPSILGFVTCGAVVRRRPFLDVGGFDDLLFFLGEEQLVAQDLAAAGWHLAYAEDVVAHHHPSPIRDLSSRRRRELRNDLLAAWMRRPVSLAARQTGRLVRASLHDRPTRGALAETARRLPVALRRRRRLPAEVERQLVMLSGTG